MGEGDFSTLPPRNISRTAKAQGNTEPSLCQEFGKTAISEPTFQKS